MSPKVTFPLVCVFLFAVGSVSHSNTVQDQQGAGARSKSMGGTGTASSSDGTAVYYNPAGLSDCKDNQVSVEVSHWAYKLPVKSTDSTFSGDGDLSDRSAVTLSSCVHLPYDATFGFLFDTGVSQVQNLNQTSINNSNPEYALYGKPLEQISLIGGLSYKVTPKLSIGLGGALLVNSGLNINTEVPVLANENEIKGEISWKLGPAAAIYGGARYKLKNSITLGVSVRTALFHKLEANARTRVEVSGVLVDVDLLLENVTWYSPLQASMGVSYNHGKKITMAADLTWYHWSAYPGPYVQISPLEKNDSIAAGLNYPEVEKTNLKDIFVPYLGIEYKHSPALAFRGGLSHRQSPASLPSLTSNSNLLDAPVTTLGLGIGYLGEFVGAKKKKNSWQVQLHARVHSMKKNTVEKMSKENQQVSQYSFGGLMADAGITMTLGW